MRLNNLSYYYIQECVEDTTQKRLSSFSPLPHTNTTKSLQNIADFLLSLADLLRRSAAAAKSLLAALRRMRVAKFFAMSGPFGWRIGTTVSGWTFIGPPKTLRIEKSILILILKTFIGVQEWKCWMNRKFTPKHTVLFIARPKRSINTFSNPPMYQQLFASNYLLRLWSFEGAGMVVDLGVCDVLVGVCGRYSCG